ncbi:hypothetical protein RhiXN_06715 [Rhizoctonia solani]|uniref:Uncharacterized protein n=1 Tax=Rhizoctonia solani TaxID=456999 RepID=A0A8H8P0H9_9AGAM|nr:uncharacterized protein RhiXN_06715 [Rhizoctonia solani]QRW21726.1 hypothetical protein RhiXN_06715 [Rhizoctonia solani]
MPDYTFPPAPSSDHLELRRPPSSPGQIPEPAPPIAHGSAYMDILNIQQARRSPPGRDPYYHPIARAYAYHGAKIPAHKTVLPADWPPPSDLEQQLPQAM